jgi:hypothetical protein
MKINCLKISILTIVICVLFSLDLLAGEPGYMVISSRPAGLYTIKLSGNYDSTFYMHKGRKIITLYDNNKGWQITEQWEVGNPCYAYIGRCIANVTGAYGESPWVYFPDRKIDYGNFLDVDQHKMTLSVTASNGQFVVNASLADTNLTISEFSLFDVKNKTFIPVLSLVLNGNYCTFKIPSLTYGNYQFVAKTQNGLITQDLIIS